MRRQPPGYGAAWSALGVGALALIVFQLAHHGGAASPAQARSSVSVPSGSSPAPAPSGAALGVSAVVSLPLRLSPSALVRGPLVIPGAPPFPSLGLMLELQ